MNEVNALNPFQIKLIQLIMRTGCGCGAIHDILQPVEVKTRRQETLSGLKYNTSQRSVSDTLIAKPLKVRQTKNQPTLLYGWDRQTPQADSLTRAVHQLVNPV